MPGPPSSSSPGFGGVVGPISGEGSLIGAGPAPGVVGGMVGSPVGVGVEVGVSPTGDGVGVGSPVGVGVGVGTVVGIPAGSEPGTWAPGICGPPGGEAGLSCGFCGSIKINSPPF